MSHVIYLHGFASSPGSQKANLFKEAFVKRGVRYHIPDLNAPDFSRLMLTAMLERVACLIRSFDDIAPVYLIGSSMGGLAALHFCDRYRGHEADRVGKIALLAPALDFNANRDRTLGDDWRERWQQQGSMKFHNYAVGEELPVHYGMIHDISGYDSFAVDIPQPVLIYHGEQDKSVDYRISARFAEQYPTTRFHLLDSDHQLLDQTSTILAGLIEFFGV